MERGGGETSGGAMWVMDLCPDRLAGFFFSFFFYFFFPLQQVSLVRSVGRRPSVTERCRVPCTLVGRMCCDISNSCCSTWMLMVFLGSAQNCSLFLIIMSSSSRMH